MRRPDADLEEKREPRVTRQPKGKTAAYEVIRVRLDIGRDREAGAQPWRRERVLMPPQPPFASAARIGSVGRERKLGGRKI
jgi:hypothetical protein